MNLISNAAEAMPEGGGYISTKNQYLDKPVSGYDNIKEGEYSVLTVKDSGVGISRMIYQGYLNHFFNKESNGEKWNLIGFGNCMGNSAGP